MTETEDEGSPLKTAGYDFTSLPLPVSDEVAKDGTAAVGLFTAWRAMRMHQLYLGWCDGPPECQCSLYDLKLYRENRSGGGQFALAKAPDGSVVLFETVTVALSTPYVN